jgi:hypothetical protein|tara:strand:+ start:3030 stop:3566 length:537 start_codon:yes stop_codon:yes gene_type:complete
MKSIGKVKLGLNDKFEVLIESDIVMNGKEDYDDLYFVMFNVMNNPLRLSIITVGNLIELAKENTGLDENKLMDMAKNDPENYVMLALGDGSKVIDKGTEKIKINLDSQDNANKSRIIISSMMEKGYFLQKSNYNVGSEIIQREQQVETENMMPQLNIMLEIIKRWDNLDVEELAKYLG